jgi:uncharacterized protein (TIGR03437 family)
MRQSNRFACFKGLTAVFVGAVLFASTGVEAQTGTTDPPIVGPIAPGSVITASAFGGFPVVAVGSWIEIYGSNLSASSRQWRVSDFNGMSAPTMLDGVSVRIGGQPAFLSYISPSQINAQVPAGIALGTTVVTVTNVNGTSAPYNIVVNAVQPGLFAPAAFKIGAFQYVGAVLSNGTLALPPNSVPGITTREAKPGETVTLYGVGCGLATTGLERLFLPGQIVTSVNALLAAVKISLGGDPVAISYAGLAIGSVGLCQFDILIPEMPDSEATPLTYTVGGISGPSLFMAIKH